MEFSTSRTDGLIEKLNKRVASLLISSGIFLGYFFRIYVKIVDVVGIQILQMLLAIIGQYFNNIQI